MSKLDKEAVLKDFTEAYKSAHGKAPKVEAANGWYSVDGGKNMRLAQLDEWAQELKGGAKTSSDKPAASKKAEPKKASANKASATKKAPAKKSNASNAAKGGKTAKELWRERLASQGNERLPRGVR